MQSAYQNEQESSSGGNGRKRYREDFERDNGISEDEIELKQHGSPTYQFAVNSSSSWGEAEMSLLRMVERNKTSRVFD